MTSIILNELAHKYNSDKGNVFHGNRGANGYMDLYARYFEKQGFSRYSEMNILEIGTNTGASLRIWAEYFPNAVVHGIDITREYEIPALLEHPNIRTHIIDGGDSKQLDELMQEIGKCAIIIDDGSHEQTDQYVALNSLFSWVQSGGLYVIEDLITGEPWMDGSTYNKHNVMPVRDFLAGVEKGSVVSNIPSLLTNWQEINNDLEYCHYKKSEKIIYDRHHPQIAFLGKK